MGRWGRAGGWEVWGCGTLQLGGRSSAVCVMLGVVGVTCSSWYRATSPLHTAGPQLTATIPRTRASPLGTGAPASLSPLLSPFGVGAALGPAWPAVTRPPGSPDLLT